MNNWNLKGKYALVTGGTRGIGKAIVEELATLEAEVLFTARKSEELESVQNQLREKGLQVTGLMADVTSFYHRLLMVKWIEAHWGALDILVNNAGKNIRKKSNEYSEIEYRQIFDLNLIAPFELSRLVYPFLIKSSSPAIVNMGSVAGSMDARTGAPYGITKAGVIQLSRNLANEWAENNIRVNTVSPWFTETPATKSVLTDKEKLEKIISRTPLKRVAKDSEVAAVVAFLTMKKASYVNGQNIIVDGGATAAIL